MIQLVKLWIGIFDCYNIYNANLMLSHFIFLKINFELPSHNQRIYLQKHFIFNGGERKIISGSVMKGTGLYLSVYTWLSATYLSRLKPSNVVLHAMYDTIIVAITQLFSWIECGTHMGMKYNCFELSNIYISEYIRLFRSYSFIGEKHLYPCPW